jgi:gluconolactonase
VTIFAHSDALWELVEGDQQVECLGTGFDFTEGPIWNAADSFLLFSDIVASRRLRWSERDGVTEIARNTNMANGMTYDARCRLIVCEHATSAVVCEPGDGSRSERTVLASHYKGRELNSPNDVVVASDGSIYFTDPTYGRLPRFGVEREPELGFQGVYRIPAGGGDLELLADDFAQPNGLCFSPGEEVLYVNDSERAEIRAYSVARDGSLDDGETLLANIRSDDTAGVPDGMKCDERGNIFVTGPHGVWIVAPDGTQLGVIEVPEVVTNLNWGGEDWHDLYQTTTNSLYRIRLLTRANKVSFMFSVP